ncbi:unnamed protein product [Zymoseptoria tritici ST99CH_1E4]|uniref:Uncharacterized protein n=1 Tax=Zymoseptoria tritici ST99CH_1E4 TaxID=1276532 RepID=A0A2H1GY32_ZYMTR|nr:unnamed protein product [Zymoseptoria tritici ST99CH_1E4]
MAKKAKQRISYVLPLAGSSTTQGHRLGVNGLAVDPKSSLLYSGGRDGVICAWDLHLDLQTNATSEYDAKPAADATATTFRQQVQAHTHWINDIALAQNNQALVSASSDITVKVWRPAGEDKLPPQTIGLHSDYVKTLAVPSTTCDWVASGGLDRKICVWDLNGAGQKLSIDVGEDEAGSMQSKEKGSVYALAATTSLLASGGPEKTVRVWDSRTGQRTTKLVGHTDNVRDILISEDGTTIMTASSDRTVKVWSTIAGRCMFTLTMHDASVWSLFSSDPDLSVVYSSDKNGLVAKTDTRNTIELDEGLSVAVCQEHEGVHKVVAAGDRIWTATSRPSINRWRDVCTDNAEIDVPENYNTHRRSSAKRYSMVQTEKSNTSPLAQTTSLTGNHTGKRRIPLKHMLRLSNTAFFPAPMTADSESLSAKRATLDAPTLDAMVLQPVRAQPEYSVEGQNGLIKHALLNDRKRVLTMDTAGEVVMWDLLKCVPIRSYGKRHIEDVKDEVTTTATVANWCTVDTRTGSVAVILEENTCFDAEMYADELDLDEDAEFKEDQRVNLGKWVLRYLFDGLIQEEIRRDEVLRNQLINAPTKQTLQREGAPSSIQIPSGGTNGWHAGSSAAQSTTTLKPGINGSAVPVTPGWNIGLATPGSVNSPTHTKIVPTTLASTTEESAPNDTLRTSTSSRDRTSADRAPDYFSTSRIASAELTTPAATSQPATTPGTEDPSTPTADMHNTPTTPGGKEAGLFGKKFRMGNMGMSSFASGMKKITRIQTNDSAAKPTEELKSPTDTDSHSQTSQTTDPTPNNLRPVDESLNGTLQKIRYAYLDSLEQQASAATAFANGLPVPPPGPVNLQSLITPAPVSELPRLFPPKETTILIQEDRPEAGGVADLFEGTVGQLHAMVDDVEKVAPGWLGEVLLRGLVGGKEVVKISFVLESMEVETKGRSEAEGLVDGTGAAVGWMKLPGVVAPGEGGNRLNANRMLRARKIAGYVAERIDGSGNISTAGRVGSVSTMEGEAKRDGEEVDGETEEKLRPEEYLELWCQGQLVPPTMTLATIRSHIWRGGGDIVLGYKSNGRKRLRHVPVVKGNGSASSQVGGSESGA